MSTTRRNQRRNAFVAGILTLAGFAVPAVAAEQQPSSYQDNVTPMSASQNAMLRHGEVADEATASPSHQSVPASRSQIEVLGLNRVHHAPVRVASH
ncbi:hypothetical protein [uncultured Salinisphaera sp.]|uniref:hypothetical protein n=1 Tax=uncultured Salinisphaera sp. TaxID=359372 RepID=UPI0032B29150|tara:strand:- start:535 stop:822 length:288 start_codon:yes stop_codon:yes gene_type:complete